MPEVCRPHRPTPGEPPEHTVALDSSLCLSHYRHTAADFGSVSTEPEQQSEDDTNTEV